MLFFSIIYLVYRTIVVNMCVTFHGICAFPMHSMYLIAKLAEKPTRVYIICIHSWSRTFVN